MKKCGIKLLFGIITFLFIGNVAAATREEMLKFIPEKVLDSFTEEQYEKYSKMDFSHAVKQEEKLYEKSKYPDEISPYADNTWTTNYKTLTITAIPWSQGSINYSIMLFLQWNYIPTVRSYDVMAVRMDNFAMNGATTSGTQAYVLSNGSMGSVQYKYLGTNMNYDEFKGFGISMNIVNDKLKDLYCYIELDAAMKQNTATVYGSYQHAVDNVSLAQSKNYTINVVGMGKVINFADSVWGHYDDMNGVKMTVSK